MNDDDDFILIEEPEDFPEDEPIIDIEGDGEFFGDSTESPTDEFGSNIIILSLDEGENLPIQSDQLTFISVILLIIMLFQFTTSLLVLFSKMKRKKILIRYEKSNVPIYIE